MALPESPVVLVVHNDPAVLHSLGFALEVEGFRVCLFGSGDDLLASAHLPGTGCLVAHQHMPGMSGLDLLERLRARELSMPAILITGQPDVFLEERAAAMGSSLVEALALLDNTLIDAVRTAFRAR